MDRLFYSLVTAFIVGVDGSIHVLLIPNSRLSRKVAKNPFFNVKNGCKCLILRSRSRINSWNSHPAQSSGRDKRKSSKAWSWRETYPMKTPTWQLSTLPRWLHH